MSSDGDRILVFVYGLLMSGGAGYRALNLSTQVRHLGPACIFGRIFDLGDYPGLVTGCESIVHGELFRFNDSALIEKLDAYELCDPANPASSEYRRVMVKIVGSGQRAWTYVYNRPVEPYRVIASGRWLTP